MARSRVREPGEIRSLVYRIPNGPPGPSTSRAQFGPTLCGPMAFSCRAVSAVVPGWRPRHDPMADFSGGAGLTLKTTRWAGARPSTTTHRERRGQGRRALAGRRGQGRRRSPPPREGRERQCRSPARPPQRGRRRRNTSGHSSEEMGRRRGAAATAREEGCRHRPPVGRHRGHRLARPEYQPWAPVCD
jgi:hypothetical protein